MTRRRHRREAERVPHKDGGNKARRVGALGCGRTLLGRPLGQDGEVDTRDRLNYFLGTAPKLERASFIAPDAVVLGDVELGELSSVWYHCVLRADINFIRIGTGSNLQDAAIVHLADDAPTLVGEYSTVGHRAILHGCSVGNETLIGMGATVLDHAEVGNRCIVGANTLVPRGMKIPEGSLVYGNPGKIIRTLSADEQKNIRGWAEKYILVAAAHRDLLR